MMHPKMVSFNYDDLARLQLEEAIRQFSRDDLAGFICAITLAHAAQGILADLLTEKPLERLAQEVLPNVRNILGAEFKSKGIIDALNSVPNGLKHGGLEDGSEFDPRLQAFVSIMRAIDAYNELNDGVTPEMKSYCERIDEAWYS